jgi:hypothetical protein
MWHPDFALPGIPSLVRSCCCALFSPFYNHYHVVLFVGNNAQTILFIYFSMASPILVRHAQVSDVDVMTAIGLAAMPMDPQWNWRFPLQHHFPQDTYHFTRSKYLQFLENRDGNWRVMLAEYKPCGQAKSIPIAFAVWDMRNVSKLQDNSSLRRTPGLYMISIMRFAG